MSDPNASGYYGHVRYNVMEMVPPDVRRVLEIGCGRGLTLRALKEKLSLEFAAGVEYNPVAGAEAQKLLDQTVIGDIESIDLPFAEQSFDCIIFADVLEHLRDPWKVLNNLSRLLKPHGCIVASIPNLRHYTAIRNIVMNRWSYQDEGLFDRTHLRFFTFLTIQRMFDEAGFRIVAVEKAYEVPDQWFLWLNRFLLRALRGFTVMQFIIRAERRA